MPIPFSGVGSPGSVGPTSGGKIYAYNNLSTTPQVVAPANTNRVSITFHNPGSIAYYVAPVTVQNTPGTVPTSTNGQPNLSNATLTPTTSALGGCWLISGGGGSVSFVGECSMAFQAFSATGSGNPCTVLDSNN